MLSKVSASSRSSSAGPLSAMRRERSVAWISRATDVMRPIGASTRPATTHPTTRLDRNSSDSAVNEVMRSVSRVCSFARCWMSWALAAMPGSSWPLPRSMSTLTWSGDTESCASRREMPR